MPTCSDLQKLYTQLLTAKHTFDASFSSAQTKTDNNKFNKQTIAEAVEALKLLSAAYTDLKEIEELKEIFISTKFIVPNAVNHYRQALLDAGLSDGSEETKEEKEVNIDLMEEINNQLTIYAEAKDKSGKPILQEWIDNISNNQDILKTIIKKDKQNIIARLKVGMIPLVMPSQSVQLRTWEKTFNCLKPLSIIDQTIRTVNDPYIYPKYASEKMNITHFFKDIPDHPYIAWTEPTRETKSDTRNLASYTQKQAKYAEMVKEHPALYSPKDIIPTEYIALQTISTRHILRTYQKAKGSNAIPNMLSPFDYMGLTSFLGAGAFSDDMLPCANFDTRPGYWRVYFEDDREDVCGSAGFRPASRSI